MSYDAGVRRGHPAAGISPADRLHGPGARPGDAGPCWPPGAVMPEFAYTDLLPLGPDETPYRLLTTDGVSVVEAGGRTFLQVEPEALRLLTRGGDARHRPPAAARPPAPAPAILDDPEASPNDRFVALDLLQEREHRGRRRAADVPGHRHRDRQGQEGPARAHRRRRRGGASPAASSTTYHDAQPALLADGAARPCGTRRTPAPTCRPQIEIYADRRRRLQVPVHGQGRRLGQQDATCSRRPRRSSTRRGCCSSSTRSCARSAPPRARRTTSPSSSAARRPSSR